MNLVYTGLRASLERLQLEYVDVVFANRPDPNTPMEGRHAGITVQSFLANTVPELPLPLLERLKLMLLCQIYAQLATCPFKSYTFMDKSIRAPLNY